jgi:hypothetical protein
MLNTKTTKTPSEPRCVLIETQIGKIPRSKTHRVGGVVQPKCLRALFVADPPAEDVLCVSHHLRLGDLALEGLIR